MKISEITNIRLDNAVQYLIERFDDSKWLLRTIYYSILSQSSKKWDAKTFYTKILNDVIDSEEFEKLFDDLVKLPIIPNIHVYNKKFIGGSIKVQSKYDLLKYLRWNKPLDSIILTLSVPSTKPVNIKKISLELESVIGHEITHLIQRLHRLKDEHYDPGELRKAIRRLQKRDAEMEMINSVHYTNVYTLNANQDVEIANYLKHGELIAYAYTIASNLEEYSTNIIEDLEKLYRYGWSEKYRILRMMTRGPATDHVIKYSEVIHRAERRGLISDDKAKKIWNKLFKEIYRNLKNKNEKHLANLGKSSRR
jgi:hypothetical protein